MQINGLFFVGLMIGGLLVNYLYKRYSRAVYECDLWRQSALNLQRDINAKNGYIDKLKDLDIYTRQSD